MNQDKSYYVYALKDTSVSPASPFYIGKGCGTRAYSHLTKEDDNSKKGQRIRKITAAGSEVLISILVDGISEIEALKIEAELISAFGTEETGGPLTNSVIPSGEVKTPRKELNLPVGVKEKAQLGLSLLKESVLEFAKANPMGITNAATAGFLGLRSDYGGGVRDYLTYSILGILMKEGLVERVENSSLHRAKIK